VTAPPDPYKTLQVDSEAEEEVIAAAYRRLAMKYHPDTAGPGGAPRMAGINAAWEILGDPARRAALDRERALAAAVERARATTLPPHGPVAPSSTPARPSPGAPSTAPGSSGAPARPPGREPESVSRDWTSGRSTFGGGYDESMRTADGDGAAGPPPGNASGSVLTFGRYSGWSLGEIARGNVEYIEWLDRTPIGRPYRDEIDTILRRAGRRKSADVEPTGRRGLFRRR